MRILAALLFLFPLPILADTTFTFYSVMCARGLDAAKIETFQVEDADDVVNPSLPPSDKPHTGAGPFALHEQAMRAFADKGVFAYDTDDGALYQPKPVECVTPHMTLRLITHAVKIAYAGEPVRMGTRPVIELEMAGKVVFSETLGAGESLFAESHVGGVIQVTRCTDLDHHPSDTEYDRTCKVFHVPGGGP